MLWIGCCCSVTSRGYLEKARTIFKLQHDEDQYKKQGLTDLLQRQYEFEEKCHICFKEFNNIEHRKLKDHCHFRNLYWRAVTETATWNTEYQTTSSLSFTTLVAMTPIFLPRSKNKNFKKNDIWVMPGNIDKHSSFNVKIRVGLAGMSNKDGETFGLDW